MDARNRAQKGNAPTGSRIAFQALGREPTSNDWLSDIDLRIGLIFLKPNNRELAGAFAERVKQRINSALDNWMEATRSYQPNSERERKDIGVMTDSLHRCKSFSTATGSVLATAIYDECEVEVDQLLEEQRRLSSEWQSLRNYPDLHLTSDQLEAYSLIEQAYACNSAERGSLLRESRNLLLGYSQSMENPPPIVRFLHGWTLYQIAQDPEEAKEVLSKLRDFPNPPFSCYLSYRLLSQFYQNAGNSPRAGTWTRSALDIESDAEGLVESALQMAGLSDPSKPMDLLSRAMMKRPGIVLRVLGDSRCLTLGDALISVILEVLERTRNEGRSATTRWAEISLDINRVQEKFPGMVSVPHDLANGHGQNLQRIDVADLISAGYFFRNAVESATNLTMAAQSSMMGELMRRSNAVSLARKATDSVADAREHRVEQAKLAYETAKAKAAAVGKITDGRTAKTERLALNSAIGGCSTFILYVLLSAAVDPNKYPVGFNKPFGFGMIAVSIFMVGIGAWLYVDAQMKSGATQRDVKREVVDAERVLDQSSKEADDFYREQMNVNKKMLTEAEEALKKAEEASKLLKIDEKAFEEDQLPYAA